MEPDHKVETFYRQLADHYHFIFADWRKTVLVQSAVLDTLLRQQIGGAGNAVLDCACGIGTQAIGLAVRGYRVHGTDLSAEAVARARREAEGFRVEMSFGVADFRELEATIDSTYDAVICCDNALAHMHTIDDLRAACASMLGRVRPGGVLLASIRDYDRLRGEQPRSTPPIITEYPEGRAIVFQIWDWLPGGDAYTVSHFTLRQRGPDDWHTNCSTSVLHAWQRAEVSTALADAGANAIEWHMPDQSGYYQPIVTARKPLEDER